MDIKIVNVTEALDECGLHIFEQFNLPDGEKMKLLNKWCDENNAMYYGWSGGTHMRRAEILKAMSDAKDEGKTAVVMDYLGL